MKTLENKIAIVTGAGTGIGRVTAKMLAEEGARVVVSGRRSGPLDDVVKEIAGSGGAAVARPTDMEDREAAMALGKWTIDTHGGVDILVNNAGHSSHTRSLQWVTREDWDGVLAVNLTGVYALTQAVLGSMLERGGGTVITVASMAAIRPGLIGGVAYSAAKAGARALMQHLHSELRQRGIRATTILPAEVDTPILDRRPLNPDAKARSTMMQADDVARAIVLCATLPSRTVVEEIVMSPTIQRDITADLEAARRAGQRASR
jgi:NADP-dependent 3-hydroxy acid dehydrogenase YdfG